VTEGQKKLGYAIDDGTIVVSTIAELSNDRLTRVYDIRDLLPAGKIEREKRAAALAKFLTDTIAPSSWKVNGGEVGAIRELQGNLIVAQTYENQKAIISTLEHLREIFAGVSVSAELPQKDQPRFPVLTTKPSDAGGK
jgi:hypothetical protein